MWARLSSQLTHVPVLRILIARVLTFVMDKEKKGRKRERGKEKRGKKKKRNGPG